jgi:hypothetical protein
MSGLLISAQPSTPNCLVRQDHLSEARDSGPFSFCREERKQAPAATAPGELFRLQPLALLMSREWHRMT